MFPLFLVPISILAAIAAVVGLYLRYTERN
jgi:hypothetical protein